MNNSLSEAKQSRGAYQIFAPLVSGWLWWGFLRSACTGMENIVIARLDTPWLFQPPYWIATALRASQWRCFGLFLRSRCSSDNHRVV